MGSARPIVPTIIRHTLRIMPFGGKPSCSSCKTSTTTMWRKDDANAVMCNSCYLNHLSGYIKDDACSVISDSESIHSGSNSGLRTAIVAAKGNDSAASASKDVPNSYYANIHVRKSSRIKPKPKAQTKSNAGKGKSRRFVFKRSVSCARK